MICKLVRVTSRLQSQSFDSIVSLRLRSVRGGKIAPRSVVGVICMESVVMPLLTELTVSHDDGTGSLVLLKPVGCVAETERLYT